MVKKPTHDMEIKKIINIHQLCPSAHPSMPATEIEISIYVMTPILA
jgi:hypothetical protein